MNQKYVPNDKSKAIFNNNDGFNFGDEILKTNASNLNDNDVIFCRVGKNRFYDIEGDSEGKSPLTGEKERFTITELEVFKVVYY